MIILRLLAGIFGTFLLLVAVPVVIFGGAVTSGDPLSEVIPLTLGVFVLVAAGYLLIAACGSRVTRSLKLRVLAATLLSIPACFAAAPMVLRNHPETWPFLLPILLFTLLLFSAFVWPVRLKRAEKPLTHHSSGTR
ncbi:MAG: hypothetical protein ABIK08_15505 [Pseudomonadota bacterium]